MDQDQNLLTLVVQIIYTNNERHLNCAFLDLDKRMIEVCEFQDNEHFSVFECLVLQVNPNGQDAKLTVLIQMPELESENRKVRDILEQCEFEVIEKSKKDFSEIQLSNLNKVLRSNFNTYRIEEQICTQCIQCLLEHTRLYKDDTNCQKFNIGLFNLNKFMRLDLAAINALMIFPKQGIKQFDSGNNASTLVDYLDRCITQMGKRCLRRWIKMPLQSIQEINQRLNIVEYLYQNSSFRAFLNEDFLKRIPDLDKLYAKFYKVASDKRNNANLSDCVKVYQLIQKIKDIIKRVNQELYQSQNSILQEIFLKPFEENLSDFERLEEMIEKSIDLSKAYTGEFIVNPRFSEKLMQLSKNITQCMNDIENVRLETETELGITVTLIESGTYTYIFEAKKQSADEAFRKNPKKYKTISVKNRALTFTVEKLQSTVADYVHYRDLYQEVQQEKVQEILKIVCSYYPVMEQASRLISEIDVLSSFASVARNAPRAFVRPIFTEKKEILLKESRHPLLEAIDSTCIVNDLEMDRKSSRLHIITGPNMGGKSTYIRQIAICVLLAHIGCFVPCTTAVVPIIDAIITRVGASDVQTKGISTFMSEMLEASCMLKTAKPDSLIIIDELGRGTSTSEGFGIAWAIAEHIAKQIQSYCLFATHFHEMTLMEHEIPGVKNYYVSCVTEDDKITMQYKVRYGAVDRSYGLLVAEMLKFPKEVIDDAKQKALELETFEHNLESNFIDEEVPIFNTIDDELQYKVRNSTLQAKERVIKEAEKWKNDLNNEKNPQKRKEIIEKRKQIILKLLK
ncbi:unnamed protein product [Paramecium primaurelia]|uniref:DNA mismatch repair proteins mutS family domain-containing protein n=1 Tax=Paramecium primaurelia TaxID=5886 RepID=A0A8S1JPR6_PARPR|nr:unnamed protein product [Paramecium primaurelia]